MRKLIVIVFSFLIYCSAYAQDGHYSHIYQNPLYLNPALIGSGVDDIRIGGIYRSQWQSIDAPYVNFGVFADAKISNFSIGFLANQNKAGDAGYRKSNAMLAAGYRKPLGDGLNALSIGAQIGLNQVSIDPTKLFFDSQYRPGTGFDRNILSGENTINGNMKMTDINIGFAYHFENNWDVPAKGTIGLAFYHVNSPETTSPTGETMNYPGKTVLHGQTYLSLNESFGLEPLAMIAFQGNYSETILGLNFGFNMTDTSGFKLGIASRLKDAVLFTAQFNLNQVSLGLGFDYNYSKLQGASGLNSAMEVSMIYNLPLENKSGIEDTDEDGIIDQKDDCPKVPGILRLNGCPEELGEKEKVDGADYDEDGILDENDLCPYEFGYPQFQGCNDQDADGIWDHIDVCPSLPGKVENHGCPVEIPGIDSDYDGVPDRFDQCIYIKGLKEFNGCPDTDEDGISDLMDDCPYIKGKKAWNGCPGDAKDGIKPSMGKREISTDVVEFETNQHYISGDYRQMLDRLAEKLKYQSKYKLVVEGHTDNEGSATFNYQLSLKRANTVKDFLIARGVNPQSIDIHHYGENKPKNANETVYGKARNRRVELILFDVE